MRRVSRRAAYAKLVLSGLLERAPGFDICAMTSEQGPRATLREDTVPFLDALKACGKRRILLTNAHPHNLAVKLKHTGLDAHLDLLLSTHTFGYPKEDQRLWRAVAEETGLEAHKTLFVDDSEAILDAAREFGIRYCPVLPILTPDWRKSSICAIRG